MDDTVLHAIENWFNERGWTPFAFQREVWNAYLAGESGLIHAPTGTGKTYAAWLGPLLEWMQETGDRRKETRDRRKEDHTLLSPISRLTSPPLRVLWVTPLRALAADTTEALQSALDGLQIPWTLETRTGDTAAAVRARQRKRLPSALVTTPESLSLFLARDDASSLFAELRLVVIDEWHELLGNKRGVQVELALARLRRLCPALRTWGLSATLGNLDEALLALVGRHETGDGRQETGDREVKNSSFILHPSSLKTRIVRGLLPKALRIDALLPETMERFPWAGHLGLKMLPQVVAAIEEGESALLFTNTRAQTEMWYGALLDERPDWSGLIALHHGSLDRQVRDWVERGLREGTLRCVVCTSSLDLGVDFPVVDRTLQIGSPKGVGRLLQRAGRSGHQPGAESRVTCVPTHAFELIEIAAARDAVDAGIVETRQPLDRPLDVLVQHVVTIALGGGFRADELLTEVRSTYAYQSLSDDEWVWVLDFVTKGGPALHGYAEYRRVVVEEGVYKVTDGAIARRHRMSIGTITSDAAITVQYLRGEKLGTVEESFIARLKPGDTFTFAGRVLKFVRVRDMTAWVRLAGGTNGKVPRWVGGRLPLSPMLSAAVRARLDEAQRDIFRGPELEKVRPILDLQAARSAIPARDELLVERVRTREGFHLFLYPFEGRLVHEGLAALLAYRLSRRTPITFTLAANDYGFELLAPEPAPLADETDLLTLLTTDDLEEDIEASLNATELARRQFREIARVSGLVFQGRPGEGKTARQLQASSGLIYDVLVEYDPDNLLLQQAQREVLELQLQYRRLLATLERLARGRVVLRDPKRPTPLAFPLLIDRLRERVSSETLADRVRKMQISFEKP